MRFFAATPLNKEGKTDLEERLIAIRPAARRLILLIDSRVRRSTNRERVLVGALLLAALSFAPIAALQWRADQEDLYTEALARTSQARLSRDVARRVDASAGDQAAVVDMRTWGFKANNLAVAQVVIEERLMTAGTTAGLKQMTITLDDKIETVGPTTWLGAEVQADLTWRAVFSFLNSISSWPEGFNVKGFGYEFAVVPLAQQDADYGYGSNAPRPSGKVHFRFAFPVEIASQDARS